MYILAKEGFEFQISVLGENFSQNPIEFEKAKITKSKDFMLFIKIPLSRQRINGTRDCKHIDNMIALI